MPPDFPRTSSLQLPVSPLAKNSPSFYPDFQFCRYGVMHDFFRYSDSSFLPARPSRPFSEGSRDSRLLPGRPSFSLHLPSSEPALETRPAPAALSHGRFRRFPRGSTAWQTGSGMRSHRRTRGTMGDHALPWRLFRGLYLEGCRFSAHSLLLFPAFRHSQALACSRIGELAAFRMGNHDRRCAGRSMGTFVRQHRHADDAHCRPRSSDTIAS